MRWPVMHSANATIPSLPASVSTASTRSQEATFKKMSTRPETATITKATTHRRTSSVCTKCAAHKKNGELNCCNAGGAWHKKCGPGRDHSWLEGSLACESARSFVVFRMLESVLKAFRTQKQQQSRQIVWCVRSVRLTRKASSVVAFLVVLGIRNAVSNKTRTTGTPGPKAWNPANTNVRLDV